MKKSKVILETNKQKKKNDNNQGLFELYNIVVDSTCATFKEKKEIDPSVLLVSDNNKIIVAQLEYCNDFNERKEVLSVLAKKLIEEKIKINATISISESWMMKANDIKNKKEVLMFSLINESGDSIQSIYKISKNKGNIMLKEEFINIDEKINIENRLLESFWAIYK